MLAPQSNNGRKPVRLAKVTKAYVKPAKKVAKVKKVRAVKLKPRPFQLIWSTRDQTAAFNEGWGLFLHGERGLEIEKLDELIGDQASREAPARVRE